MIRCARAVVGLPVLLVPAALAAQVAPAAPSSLDIDPRPHLLIRDVTVIDVRAANSTRARRAGQSVLVREGASRKSRPRLLRL